MKTKKLTELSFLTALALIIFIVELQLPNLSPVQGLKLGLANIITVYAVWHYSATETFMIVFCRIVLGGIFSGNISSLIYSISGSLLCLVGMILLKRLFTEKQIWICSIFGAVLHNTGQIAAAAVVTKSLTVIAYYPYLLVGGCIAGAFTGVCAMLVLKRLK